MEVFGKLLGQSIDLASIRTLYRVLAELGETKSAKSAPAPHLREANAPRGGPERVLDVGHFQAATLQKGVFLHAYVILDLFSRYVVGWMVAATARKHLVARRFADTVARHRTDAVDLQRVPARR